ncbi:PIN domain-containing protein [Stomatobaculum longum]|uniref:PIN domain-containing protein n=1 Tax=Stomatobaculum longum TaxID=796942 RepID=UPI0028046EEB|nr:PIN domain-containing protein [Stomatobaculum longum]
MNLMEVSACLGRPVDELKEILLDKLNKIVLSEYIQMDEKVLKELLAILNVDENTLEPDEMFSEKIERTSHNEKIIFVTEQCATGCAEPRASSFPERSPLCEEEDKSALKESLSNDEKLLRELNEIDGSAVGYTKKLIRYCFECKYLIFIDTCSLMNENFYEFYDIFVGLSQESSVLYVPYVVMEELKRLIKKGGDIAKVAKNRLEFIAVQCENKKMQIVGDEEDKRTNEFGKKVIHADRVLIEKLIYFRNDSRSSLLITQDYGVTVDALKQNEWQSTKSNAQIIVKKIGREGVLIDNSRDIKNPELPID